MARYSVAEAKNGLPRLIDKALGGEEVVITRHGKPTVELRAVQAPRQPERSQREWMAWLKEKRDAGPKIDISSLELKRLEQEDYRY
jgi:antitoxin (DNA-binding transcriptional repressor) of toxin-antitoxin stability system